MSTNGLIEVRDTTDGRVDVREYSGGWGPWETFELVVEASE